MKATEGAAEKDGSYFKELLHKPNHQNHFVLHASCLKCLIKWRLSLTGLFVAQEGYLHTHFFLWKSIYIHVEVPAHYGVIKQNFALRNIAVETDVSILPQFYIYLLKFALYIYFSSALSEVVWLWCLLSEIKPVYGIYLVVVVALPAAVASLPPLAWMDCWAGDSVTEPVLLCWILVRHCSAVTDVFSLGVLGWAWHNHVDFV